MRLGEHPQVGVFLLQDRQPLFVLGPASVLKVPGPDAESAHGSGWSAWLAPKASRSASRSDVARHTRQARLLTKELNARTVPADMAYDDDTLNDIYEKTDGRCHLCRKAISFKNYGSLRTRGAWEVDHSRPKARGGTDYLRNLLPACIPCNRSKQDGSTRSVRARSGLSRAPLSWQKKADRRAQNVALGGSAGLTLGAVLGGPVGAAAGLLLGGLLGHHADVE